MSARRGLFLRALVVVSAMTGCGSEPAASPDPFKNVDPTSVLPDDGRVHAAPRWQAVATLRGGGETSRSLEIPDSVIQWRVRWDCNGREKIEIQVDPAPEEGPAVGGGRCPGKGEQTSVQTGATDVAVRAAGRWTAVVEHQVDTPIDEPPLPAMSAAGARVISRGTFEDLERKGKGDVVLYRLASGRLALRLEEFTTTASTDLELWISPGPRPSSSERAARARHVSIAPLKSTAGPQNYLLPKGTSVADVGSVVLWCEPLYVAYAAAGLNPAK